MINERLLKLQRQAEAGDSLRVDPLPEMPTLGTSGRQSHATVARLVVAETTEPSARPDITILITAAASGIIDRRDWQIIDCVHIQRLGLRETARLLGINDKTVRQRLAKVRRLSR